MQAQTKNTKLIVKEKLYKIVFISVLFAVFPANIYLIQSESAQLALGITKKIAIIRAPFQVLFLGLAYWHSKP